MVTVPVVLSPAASRRLSNQIGRAFRGTYGAKTGLRTIVNSIARQLLDAGAPPQGIAAALEECVLANPARLVDDPRNVVTGMTRSETLVEFTRECVAKLTPDVEQAK